MYKKRTLLFSFEWNHLNNVFCQNIDKMLHAFPAIRNVVKLCLSSRDFVISATFFSDFLQKKIKNQLNTKRGLLKSQRHFSVTF